jgi:hypothetical protein
MTKEGSVLQLTPGLQAIQKGVLYLIEEEVNHIKDHVRDQGTKQSKLNMCDYLLISSPRKQLLPH